MSKIPKVFHPVLFAVFPVIFLYSHNIGEVFLSQTLLPFAVCLSGVALLWWIIFAVLKNKIKSGILATLIAVCFFNYGHFFNLLENVHLGSLKVGIHTYILPFWILCFGASFVFILRSKRELFNFTRILNVISICLVGISAINVGILQVQTFLNRQGDGSLPVSTGFEGIKAGNIIAKPNIYYIILDGHLRPDLVKKYFGHDSSPFVSELKNKQFFFADKSRSNYTSTVKSIPSSLNFKYLSELTDIAGYTPAEKKEYLRNMLFNNRLFEFLRQQGYKTVAFSTNSHFTSIKNADVYLSGVYNSNSFTNELINSTPVIALEKLSKARFYLHYRKLKYILDFLPETAKIKSPHIVFAHILCPHTPYVFDQDGTFKASGDIFRLEDDNPDISKRKAGYLEQLKYIDKKISEVIDGILANSKQKPIIILQADHGVRWLSEEDGLDSHYSILNALLLPGYDYSRLNNDITPVNTFRFILNYYFGTELEILENKTYISGSIVTN